MLDKLKRAARDLRTLVEEIRSLDIKEKDANQALKNCTAHGSLDDPKTQRKVGDARIMLDLVSSRRANVKRLIDETIATIKAEYAAADEAWTTQVKARHLILTNRLHAALLPFFEGNTNDMLNAIEPVHFPVLHEVSRAHTPDISPIERATEPAQIIETVKTFVRHVQSQSKRLGLPNGEAS